MNYSKLLFLAATFRHKQLKGKKVWSDDDVADFVCSLPQEAAPAQGSAEPHDNGKRLRQFQNDLGNYEGKCRLAGKDCDANAFNAGWLAHEARSKIDV